VASQPEPAPGAPARTGEEPLAAERARLEVEQRIREAEQARQAAQEQAAQMSRERERLAEERRRLEAARAAAREQEAREQAREQAAQEREAREQAREQAAQEREARGQEIREQQARERGAAALPAPRAGLPGSPAAPGAAEAPPAPATPSSADRVSALLALAEQDLAKLRLTSPAGANAMERYRAVLALEPDNARALEGLDRIVERYLELARRAQGKEDLAQAATFLERARQVSPQHPALAPATARLDLMRREQARLAAQQAARDDVARREREAERSGADQRAREAAERRAREQRREEREARALREAELARRREGEQARSSAEAQALRSARIGIFPDERIRSCYHPIGGRVEDGARQVAAARPGVELTYSYYARGADTAALGPEGSLWTGSAAQKEPRVEAVRAAARALEVDAVLMGWYECHDSQFFDDDTYTVYLYLVDVRTGEVRHAAVPVPDTIEALRELTSALFAARGL
jgi:hypothetical protein